MSYGVFGAESFKMHNLTQLTPNKYGFDQQG